MKTTIEAAKKLEKDSYHLILRHWRTGGSSLCCLICGQRANLDQDHETVRDFARWHECERRAAGY